MDEFMNIIVLLIAMLLFTTQTRSIENKDRASSELRRALFAPVKNSLSKRTSKLDDVKFFEGISESALTTTTEKSSLAVKRKNENATNGEEKNYDELKVLLIKLLDKIGNIEKDPKRDTFVVPTSVVSQTTVSDPSRMDLPEAISASAQTYSNINRKRKVKDRSKHDKKQRWGKWTNWSPCSVSCGRGREIRWRHCLENCDVAETEMEEKTCQLPACGPSKLFGVIKL